MAGRPSIAFNDDMKYVFPLPKAWFCCWSHFVNWCGSCPSLLHASSMREDHNPGTYTLLQQFKLMGAEDVLKARAERIALNAAMMQQVVGAAHDLAETVESEGQQRETARVRASRELKERLREEAQRAGPRTSLRSATSATRQRIAKALVETDSQPDSGTPGGIFFAKTKLS
jgi:hypothetical protein